jgi:replicative DNA helicase
MPPHSEAAESAVLGAALIDTGAAAEVCGSLSTADYFLPKHQHVHNGIATILLASSKADQIALAEELSRAGKLDQVGGHVFLSDLACGVATAGNVSQHIGIVREKADRRLLIDLGSDLAAEAGSGKFRPQEVHERFLDRMYRETHGEEGQFSEMDSIMTQAMESVTRSYRSGGELPGLDTGISGLNEMIGGLSPSDLVILGARPAIGKTGLACGIALDVAEKERVSVAILSLEMSREQVAHRFLARRANVDLLSLRRGSFAPEVLDKLARADEEIKGLPVHIDDSPGLNTSQTRSRLERLHQRSPLALVLVDYLQLMRGPGETENERINGITTGLKHIAKDLHVPVLALSQLSRAAEARPSKRPQMADLRGSGGIEQDADVVMLLYRPGSYGIKDEDGADLDDYAELIIEKQRNGPTGSIELKWCKKTASFEEP